MQSSDYSIGTQIWIRDEFEVWIQGTISRAYDGNTIACKTIEGKCIELTIKNQFDLPPLQNPSKMSDVNDVSTLSHLHEPAVLHTLKQRFVHKMTIYTYCGVVLVAINPFSDLSLHYGSDVIRMYTGRERVALNPHIYAIAEEAYSTLGRTSKDQSLIISGESGAGKTVSAKHTMAYLAAACRSPGSKMKRRSSINMQESQVEQRVLSSSPMLEALGNAKTQRNDNSSRFGKFTEVLFSHSSKIKGVNIRTYLLEKSRVVTQGAHERNYHIFYQLCAARNELKELNLGAADEYNYLTKGGTTEVENVDDFKEYQATLKSFELVGFSEDVQSNLLKILASILHLGNISIKEGNDASSVASDDHGLSMSSDLLQIDRTCLSSCICLRRISVGKEVISKSRNGLEAIRLVDALAKHLYSRAFDWVIAEINRALNVKGETRMIGILDIYGFEFFKENSFEQFCINYANEKLQQQFTNHVFKLDQAEYAAEGIDWSRIDFCDNQPCIELIESNLGVMKLLDEECKMPKGNAANWVIKMNQQCSKSQHYKKPRFGKAAFIIAHFAGDVEYDASNFLEKNRDQLSDELVEMLSKSRSQFLKNVVEDRCKGVFKSISVPKTAVGKSESKKTVGCQFRDSLNALMFTLNQTTPHYVRCIKPNDSKRPFEFNPRRAVEQLQSNGVIETVRISAQGYPSRLTYEEFHRRYVALFNRSERTLALTTACQAVVSRVIQKKDQYQFGKSKIFLRQGQVATLERLRSNRIIEAGNTVLAVLKGWTVRKKYLLMRSSAVTVQKWVRGWLARKYFKHEKETKAAVTIQSSARMWITCAKFLRVKKSSLLLQTQIRGYLARQNYSKKVEDLKSHRKTMRQVVLVQKYVRGFLARCKLRALRNESLLVSDHSNLKRGMESKIVSLAIACKEEQTKNRLLEQTIEAERKDSRIKDVELAELMKKIRELEERNEQQAEELQSSKQELLEMKMEWKEEKQDLESQVKNLHHQLAKEQSDHDERIKEAEEHWKSEMEAERIKWYKEFSQDREESPVYFSRHGSGVSLDSISSGSSFVPTAHLKHLERSHSLEHLAPGFSYSTLKTSSRYADKCAELERVRSEFVALREEYEALKKETTQQFRNLEVEFALSNKLLKGDFERLNDLMRENSSELFHAAIKRAETLRAAYVDRQITKLQHGLFCDPSKSTEEVLRDNLIRLVREKRELFNCFISREVENKAEVRTLRSELELIKARRDEALNSPESPQFAAYAQLTINDLEKKVASLTEALEHARAKNSENRGTTSVVEDPLTLRVKKGNSVVGAASYKHEHLGLIMQRLITGLTPDTFKQLPTVNLPACLLFMMFRFNDITINEIGIEQLMDATLAALVKVSKKRWKANNFEELGFWISNVNCLLQLMSQLPNVCESGENTLKFFDVSKSLPDLKRILRRLVESAVSCMVTSLEPFVVAALIEQKQGTSFSAMLDDFNEVLRRLELQPEIIVQIFRNVFRSVSSMALNILLLRKDLLNWSSGLAINSSIGALKKWFKDRVSCEERWINEMELGLAPIKQAASLLQARKIDDTDATKLLEMCSDLQTTQILAMLNSYTAKDEFEAEVSRQFIKTVEEILRTRTQVKSFLLVERSPHLFFAISSQSGPIQLDKVEIPDCYNGLKELISVI